MLVDSGADMEGSHILVLRGQLPKGVTVLTLCGSPLEVRLEVGCCTVLLGVWKPTSRIPAHELEKENRGPLGHSPSASPLFCRLTEPRLPSSCICALSPMPAPELFSFGCLCGCPAQAHLVLAPALPSLRLHTLPKVLPRLST